MISLVIVVTHHSSPTDNTPKQTPVTLGRLQSAADHPRPVDDIDYAIRHSTALPPTFANSFLLISGALQLASRRRQRLVRLQATARGIEMEMAIGSNG
ncbi:hypothetical protein D0544_08675 [Aestuariirhabdus litorea]|uniref:Uncharacterized protein n=1 Tax=Aestuariirhabdus litorea TaxID=2528527 RepID=A0A3P3VRP9_9GAMM|nr:hypothetical protein D0544_08675 [Aestuariirhabdus litorea]